ncbi:hypothetical protein FJY94_00500 [Candidatus Kaiserbacteria bacterium]|nr:hypothetical protein [Candidatus Kaiserbacteria bacterium]
MHRISFTLVLIAAICFAFFFAEQALPGNPLYILKVNVNEPVRSLTGITAESRIGYDIEFALRRLHEAERLAAHDALTAGAATTLETRFAHSAGKARRAIDAMMQLNAVRAAELNMQLAAGLSAHEAIMRALGERGDTARARLAGLASATGSQLNAAAPGNLTQIGKNASTQQLAAIARRIAAEKPAVRAKVREASNKAGVSGVLIDSLEESLVSEAEAFLAAADSHYAAAQGDIDSTTNDKVYVTLLTSLSAIVQAPIFAQAALDVHVDGAQRSTPAEQ